MSSAAQTIHAPAKAAKARYRLVVMDCPDTGPRIQVVDCDRGCRMFDWQGDVARYLLHSGEFERLGTARNGCYPCDKQTVWHLALAAAAARSVIARLSPMHQRVTHALFSNVNHHHTADDVLSLLAVENHTISAEDVGTCLGDLVREKIIQRIAVDTDNVFYDVDTRPHRHSFDPANRRLYDA